MNADAILGMLMPLTYFSMLAVESMWPAREFPKVPRWRLMGFGFFVLIGTVSSVVPTMLPREWLARHRLVDGTSLGVVGGVLVGLIVIDFVAYWVHRAYHRAPLLWRMHQMHHGVQRIDLASSAVFHPLEMTVQAALGVVMGTFVLGLEPLAAGVLGYIAAFLGMFHHLNVRTPRWVGLFVQRPEAHCRHHEVGVHASNYGNLALWDLAFGTFHNPDEFSGRVGFGKAPSFAKMLLGRDVSTS